MTTSPQHTKDVFVARRAVILGATAFVMRPASSFAQTREIWSVAETYAAMQKDQLRLIDIRSRQEWSDTGVAAGAWPISLHEDRFPERLFAARSLADERPVALICATGGRSGHVLRSLRQGGYQGYIDVSEGMLGSSAGPGWISEGLPIIDVANALASLPETLL
jgi:rhodanese-related sulfurtransferase